MASQQVASNSKKRKYGVVAVIVAIIVIGVVYVSIEGKQMTSVRSTVTTSISPASIGYVYATCGSSLSCMNKSEVASLVGSGGQYSALYTYNVSAFASGATGSKPIQGITALYEVTYHNGTSGTSLTEDVYQSRNAQADYNSLLSGWTVVSTKGMLYNVTYAYNAIMTAYNSQVNFLGWKNNDTVYIYVVSSNAVNATSLAKIVAVDTP